MKTPEQIVNRAINEAIREGTYRGWDDVMRVSNAHALMIAAIEADRAQRPLPMTPDTHCFREESPTERCEACGWLAGAHTGCDCEDA